MKDVYILPLARRFRYTNVAERHKQRSKINGVSEMPVRNPGRV